ncbi:protein unc-13 homolog C-like [Ptychodera flava]|uniref:protein unc-13 homolog C-like n=1 Tax=Ptychodera flava TaxID=63121 RepID=UPI00396AA401
MNNNFALLQSRLDNVEEDLNDIKVQIQEDGERITELEKLKFEIDKMKVNSSVIADSEMQGDDSAGLLKSAVDDMRKSINEIKKEKDDLENRSRRNNLVFFGITQDRTNENWEDSEDKVIQVIRNQLGIADNVEFERVHRMTNAPPVRDCKPIVARFRSFKDREKVLRNAFKLKNTNISVSEDFSRRVRRIRSKLWGHRRALLETNKDLKAHLQYDKLVVKGLTANAFSVSTKRLVRFPNIPFHSIHNYLDEKRAKAKGVKIHFHC